LVRSMRGSGTLLKWLSSTSNGFFGMATPLH
jgi:hypothetical protein